MEQDKNTYLIALAALRYSLGRSSYICSSTADWIMKYWSSFTLNNQKTFLKEVEEALTSDGWVTTSDQCDLVTWTNFHNWMLEEGGLLGKVE